MDKLRPVEANLLAAALILATFVTFSTFSTPTLAQPARWYQVEVMVFTQPAGPTDEQWPPEPTLDYPDNFQLLIPLSELPLQAQASDDASMEIDVKDSGVQERGVKESALQTPSIDNVSSDDAIEWLLPTPFALLPRSSLEFGNKTAYMRRAGGYHILFHETWAQPVGARSESRSLIIDRSLEENGWPELQGSVRLWLSRYLHLETDLWLNTQGEYLSPGWSMTAPPRAPDIDEDEDLSMPLDDTVTASNDDELLFDAPVYDEALFDAPLVDESASAVEIYPYRHAVLMQQKRRFRSNEVHYLDHPLLGMVVKFTPLDEEQLHALALEEPR